MIVIRFFKFGVVQYLSGIAKAKILNLFHYLFSNFERFSPELYYIFRRVYDGYIEILLSRFLAD